MDRELSDVLSIAARAQKRFRKALRELAGGPSQAPRQAAAIAASEYDADDQGFVGSVSEFNEESESEG